MTEEEAIVILKKVTVMFDEQIKTLKKLQFYNDLLLWFLYGVIFAVVLTCVVQFYC